jgi:hypothetical protein
VHLPGDPVALCGHCELREPLSVLVAERVTATATPVVGIG